MRIVADVNVLISATIAPLGFPRAIMIAWQDGHLDLVTSEGILVEVEEKLRSPRIAGKYRLSEDDILAVLALLRTQAELVLVPNAEIRAVTGDPEDDYVLATAAVAGTDCLVTGDRGLLGLREHRGVSILTPRQFIDLLSSGS